MADFFRKAPVQDTFQKRFFESIFHKHNIVGSFPAGLPILSLYSFPAMMTSGMAVVVCPDRYTIQRNIGVLRQFGYEPPALAVLDGSQMPHEERQIQSDINHNRVQLLYTVPEKFASITFMQILVHALVKFLVIEDAHYLLEGFPGTYRYWKLWEGLENLRKRPPMLLFTQPLAPSRLHELTRRLSLGSFEAFQKEPAFRQTRLRVKLAWTENEKFRYLTGVLTGTTDRDRIGRVLNPGSVLIRTNGRKSAQKVAGALHQVGFDPVFVYHPGLEPDEREQMERMFFMRRNAVAIIYGYGTRFLKPPVGEVLKVIEWEVPPSLESLFGLFFQVPEDDPTEVEGHLIYTKEDYEAALRRINYEVQQELGTRESPRQQVRLLKEVRTWSLSEDCRFQTLIALWHGGDPGEVAECGWCDRCLATSNGGFLRRMIKQWVY